MTTKPRTDRSAARPRPGRVAAPDRNARTARAGDPASAAGHRPLAVTTFRIFRDQLVALQRIALDRRLEGAAGRTDASAVLRDLLDQTPVVRSYAGER